MRSNKIQDVYALSPPQGGMLFHTLYDPEAGTYLDQLAYSITGNINIEAFEWSWRQIMERHPILRTSFHWEGLEEPVQVVHQDADVPITYMDWRDCPAESLETKREELLRLDRERGIDLSQAPLMRLTLAQTGPDSWHFLWTIHHLVIDRWSITQVLTELVQAYETRCNGQRLDLPRTKPYRDYIRWLGEQDSAKVEAYWKRTLDGFTSPTMLPIDRSPGGLPAKENPPRQEVRLSEDISSALQTFARQHRLTMNTLVQGAWTILLSRYSGESDIVFGSTVSGRPTDLEGVDTMVGMFINAIPIRVRVDGSEELIPWLQRLQDNNLDAREFEYSSLVQIQSWSEVPRGTPVFENLVVSQNYDAMPRGGRDSGGALKLQPAGGHQSRGFPLNLMAIPGNQLRLSISYDLARFSSEDIGRMLDHLSNLLKSIAADSNQRLADMTVLSDGERLQLIGTWNETVTAYPHDRGVHQLFEDQVERTPDSPALAYGNETLTYVELNSRSNQLAHYLKMLGVGPEVAVGLCVDRSIDMVVGVLGVLKAGGAYVPLDPSLPLDRLSFMLEDAQAPVLLTRESCLDAVPNSWAHVVCLDTDWAMIGMQSEENPSGSAEPDNLAYMIYTSGSTGKPKGAMICHKGLTNYLAWATSAYNVAEGTGSPVHSSLSFDLTVTSLFPALLTGRTAWLLSESDGVEALSGALKRSENLSLVKITPAHLELLSRQLSPEEAAGSTHAFVVGGEALYPGQIAFFRKYVPDTRIINEYGPTEAVVGCCVYDCGGELPEYLPGGLPIGRPIANTRLYVLDGFAQPTPVGVTGELYIGGDGLARGYLNRPDQTAERFVPDPYSQKPGERLYRTGDLARYMSDGNLEFLGRMDNQVKIRGFRIELGEIESVLAQHPAVREVAVLAREDIPGDKRLVAYVAGGDGVVTADSLAEHLSGKLPDYMVPTAFVFLEALPLAHSGKVDRKALPAPDGRGNEDAYIAPRTPEEVGLAAIWSEVLHVERVGAHDNFFSLGGHSLLATQVISRIRTTFQIDLPISALFELPTVEELSARISASLGQEDADTTAISPADRSFALPLSFAQQRLWFLDQLEPGTSLYNIPSAIRLRGLLNQDALEASFIEIIRRHEVLRTTFEVADGDPVQVIHAPSDVRLEVSDLSSLPEAVRESEARQLFAKEALQPFDLAAGPMFRVGLVRLAAEEHILLLTLHHSVSDGWSFSVLLRELEALYNAFLNDKASPLPDLPIQYADYASWQRNWLQGEELERQIGYWRDTLTGAPALLELPTDRSRPSVQTFNGARIVADFPGELLEGLNRLGQGEGATLFMTLLAAFQTLLSRYSGLDDIVVGTTIANRTRSEVEGLIGYFVNTLALRTDLSGDPGFRNLLGSVRESSLAAFAHQDLPFEKLVEELEPERSLSHSPIFQVMFAVQNAPDALLELEGLQIESVRGEGVTAKFDISLLMGERDGSLRVWLEYNTDLFGADRMNRFLSHFQTLLGGIVADPNCKISRLPLLDKSERGLLLDKWNATETEYPSNRCVHTLLEEQAERTPESVAIVYQQDRLTFRELNKRSNQVANHLISMGIGCGDLVGLCIERSTDMVVGLLGVLKSGAAYVPMDPSNPPERLAYMLEDSQVSILLTQDGLRVHLEGSKTPVLCLDTEWESISRQVNSNPVSLAGPDDLAYVIYTSGTTGKPKGAMIRHQGLTNYLSWSSSVYNVAEGTGSPVHSSLSFDLTVTSLFPALLTGRTVWLLPESEGVEALSGALKRSEDLSLVKITPAHLELLSRELSTEEASGRTNAFIVGGEALFPEQIAFFRENAPKTRIINEYGPTETVVGCCVYDCGGELPSYMPGGLPIGRPIANTRLYVLDSSMQPTPVGVAGELYVGGDGLARGYLNRPDQTAERFVPDPYSKNPGKRLYRTGDLVRYLPDGNLEFLSRIDNQVKIRGFRIELGEIESTLALHESVKDCVVLSREDVAGDRRLVAYVVIKDPNSILVVSDLRSFLSAQLPEYMIPSTFAVLESLPLASSGKVDRKALPAPEGGECEGEYTAPRTPIEEGLAEIWGEVLHVERVGIHDGFFALGGHSLLATQVISRVRTTFQAELPLRALFESPTVAGMAERIISAKGRETVETPPLTPVSRLAHLPLSFSQQRLWFLDQLEPGTSLYNIPTALRMTGKLDRDTLEASFTEIVRRHEVLRTTFDVADGEPVQVIHTASIMRLAVTDLSSLPADHRESEARELIAKEAHLPFDLTAGPLFRASLLKLGDEEHILLFTLHHAVSDGWSFSLLLRELEAVYNAFTHGMPSPLQELPIQYADYSSWQRDWLNGEELERQIAYWRKSLTGAPAMLELPTDRPRPAMQTFSGARTSMALRDDLLPGLKALCRREGATLFMTLLAAFQTLLSRYSGQDDIVVGTTIANRTRTEVEGLIGFFVNTLALRGDLSGAPSFRDLLRRVRESALGAYAHQDLPFEKLVEELDPQRSLSQSPIFQVMFAVQNLPPATLQMDGLQVEGVQGEGVTAKFDMNFTVGERDGTLRVWVEYNTDLFDPDRMERLIAHYETLLSGIIANPDETVTGLPLLIPSERTQILETWNAKSEDYPRDRCIHEIFEQQVELTPGSIALCVGEYNLTYEELNSRANRLARHLRRLGVGAGNLVAVCMERSADMVVALLGVLKSGGAYVPVDPAYPAERIRYMLEDSGSTIILTQEHLLEELPKSHATTAFVDRDSSAIAAEDSANLESVSGPSDLAYVIYTSGSTGKPKGVAIEHHSPVALVTWALSILSPEELSGVVFGTSVCFDLSIYEMFVTLCGGGRVILVEHALAIPNLSPEMRPTLINTVPSAIAELVRQGTVPDSVITINLAGEPLSGALVDDIYRTTNVKKVYDLYGPSEDTTYSTWTLRELGGRVTIGRPIANTKLYILDRELEPVPVGVPGELYISGEGLARGYLGRPELTEERFIPNPFCDGPYSRMYRTGDVCRYFADGNVEYLGRADHQVKIRGFRIELGEIESVLLQHPDIREAIALAREDTPGDKRLVGYLTSESGQEISFNQMRDFLKERLPDYMVPSAFVWLDAFPQTPNGKVDRKALPTPEGSVGEDEYTAPRTPIEEGLAEIWSEVLHVERVGIHDSFFALGGHSLLATQVISRVRTTFQVELPLRSLFEAPTVAGMAERIVSGQREETVDTPPLGPVSREVLLPLSFAQQRLWFLDQLEPGTSLYNIPTALRLTGKLDRKTLEGSFSELVRRHEVLRTTFGVGDGDPVQVIHAPYTIHLEPIDLSSVAQEDRESEARGLIAKEAQLPFDLTVGPLFRAGLVMLGDEEHILLFTLHHAVSDGWSFSVLLRELEALYNALLQDKPSPLVELPIQYADYASWQRDWLKDEELERQISYWRQSLAGVPAKLELPTDRPRPAMQTFRGASTRVEIPQQLTKGLIALGQREGATLFMTLLAGFQTLLSRYSGQEDVVVGTPIANRTHHEMEGLIGLFMNTLALRGDLSGDPTFKDLLMRVRETALGAYAHQDLPFEKLVEELDPERSLSHSPIFQVIFSLHNAPSASLAMEGLEVTSVRGDGVSSKFDISITLSQGENGLRGDLEYNTDLFDRERMVRLAAHFQRLLGEIVADPNQRLSQIPILTDFERSTVLEEWNATGAEYPRDRCIHELFEEQALRTPDSVAIECGAERITYAELNARSNQLARYLRKRGVGSETLVGLCVERSCDMVVGLVGIMKSGGAYVPLDPAWPRERLSQIANNARLELVVTESGLSDVCDLSDKVCLDTDGEVIAKESKETLPSLSSPSSLAYVLHTSGSTGVPKGVQIPHEAVVNFLASMAKTPGINSDDILLAVTTISFDIAGLELYLPLLCGAKVVIASREEASDGERLAELLSESNATIMQATPATWRMLESAGWKGDRKLKVLCGGEALPSELARMLLDRCGELWNVYGPTETTIWSTVEKIESADDLITIGRPIDNTTLYILDNALQPAPIGVPGELYIGGDGLARGYLNRPDLTAEKFVPNPFVARAGEGEKGRTGDTASQNSELRTQNSNRLYRTGDLARYLPDGRVECLGRVDHQVKVRGFRIELGEIESVLNQHPGVRESVVVAREDVAGDRKLVAYTVTDPGDAVSSAELREYVKGKLPDYMVPAALVELGEFPLTSSGKVDRNALPAPEIIAVGEEHIAPRTPIEEGLCDIWSELLNVDVVGIHDSFFNLGGHSLLAARLISRIRGTFQAELPLRELFDAPTIAELAKTIEETLRSGEGLQLPPLVRASRDRDLPLSFSQQRLWFIDQLDPGSHLYNMPRVIRLRGVLDTSALRRTLEEIVSRHEALRTIYLAKGNVPVQVISEDSSFPLQEIDLRGIAASERELEAQRMCREEAKSPFDLSQDRMIRAKLLRMGDEDQILLLTQHHIASDGWSNSVLMRELSVLYNAFRESRPSPLPELPIQYADYAVWQREWLDGEVLDRHIAYWRERLSGVPPVLEFPTDSPRETATSYRGETQTFTIPADVTEMLRNLSREERATQFMVLLAAYKVLLYKWTGQRDLVVGTDLANRNQAETERLIGFFLNHLVLRTDLSGDPSFREVVRRVRETALGAYAHQDLPFDKLVEALRPERTTNHTPIFQALFVVDNIQRSGSMLDGLERVKTDDDVASSKFDLTIFLGESSGSIHGSWLYRSDLFESDTISRLSLRFQYLIRELADRPDIPIGDIEFDEGGEQIPDIQPDRLSVNGVRGARRRAMAIPVGADSEKSSL